MSVSLVVAGTSYTYPAVGETAWGAQATAWAQAVSTSMLQTSGGTFFLTADANFGTSFGLISKYFTSAAANSASDGAIRLANLDFIKWRNAANSADLGLQLDASNVFQLGSALTIAGNITASNFSGSNTGDVTLAAFGSTPNANGLTMGAGQILNLQPASGTNPGGVSTVAQTFAGAKTFSTSAISPIFASSSANPAATGVVQLANADGIGWRNAGNTADFLLKPDADGFLQYNSIDLANISSSQTFTNKTIAAGSNTISGLVNANLSGSAAITNANLATMAANTVKANVTGGSATPTDVSIVSAATASAAMIRDSNANVQINNLIENFSTTATAGTTTTLTVSSSYAQQFTGTLAQTCVLPAANTLILGQQFYIVNRSTGIVTVNANGGGLIQTMAGNTQVILTVTNIGSGAGSWDASYNAAVPLTTKGDLLSYNTQNARFPVGSDGQVIQADSSQTLGIKWTTLQQGAKNYITYNNFENNATTGWSLGTVGTLTNGIPTGSPTFGSGASGNLSISTVSSSQLAGSYSLSYVSSAATTQGNMLATQAYTIDAEDNAKVLTFKFYYNAFSGTANCNFSGTSSNSFGVAIYDVTNSAWLSSTANFGMTQGTGIGYCTGTCQTASSTASLRFVIYNANATAGAATLYFDDFSLGPQTAPSGPVMTDWVAYTPTFGAGFGTCTNISFDSRREGDSLRVRGLFTTGTVSAAAATISVGFAGANANVTIDTTKVSATNGILGSAQSSLASTTYFTTYPIAPGSNDTKFSFSAQSSTIALGNGAVTANNMSATGSKISVDLLVPIVGWSSNVQMSNDTDTRVCTAKVSAGIGSGSLTANTDAIVPLGSNSPSISFDTHGGWSSTNNQYVVPVSGFYRVSTQVEVTGTWAVSDWAISGISVNGGAIVSYGAIKAQAAAAYPLIPTGSGVVQLNAGDTVKLTAKTNASSKTFGSSLVAQSLTLERLTGPSVIAATESVNARYFASATTLSGSLATISWTTKDFDSHGGMSAGTYTIPISGKYQINTAIALSAASAAAGNAVDLQIQKNGAVVSEISPVYQGTQVGMPIWLNDTLNCLAGDTIRVQVSSAATTPAITASNSKNYFSIERVGN